MTEEEASSPPRADGNVGFTNTNDNVVTNQTEDDPLAVLKGLQTGDLLLYRTRDLGAQFNSVLGGSFYSHVSVIIKADPEELEALYPNDYKKNDPKNAALGLALLEAEPRRGVAIFPMIARLARTIDTIRHLAVRRHVGDITSENHDSLMAFVRKVRGRKLEVASLSIVRAVCFNRFRCLLCHKESSELERFDRFFCSELVAEALMKAGVIRSDLDGVTSNLLIPSSFEDPAADRRQRMRHSCAFDFLKHDKICRPGHTFGVAEVLVEPKNTLEKVLQQKKKDMKEAQRRRRMTEFRKSIFQSMKIIQGKS